MCFGGAHFIDLVKSKEVEKIPLRVDNHQKRQQQECYLHCLYLPCKICADVVDIICPLNNFTLGPVKKSVINAMFLFLIFEFAD